MLKKLVLISALALSALGQTPSTPGQPLSLDTSSRVKRSFKIPAAKTFTLESGSTLAIDDGTVFSIGSTAASSLRTAIGDLNGMKTWTSAANRALSTPTFLGQLGIQTDTSYLYRASGTGQGDWDSLVNMQTIYTEGVTITSGGISSTSTTGAAISAYRDGGVYAAPIVLIDNDVSSSPGLSVGSTGTGALIQTTTGGVVTSTIDKNGVFLIGYGAVGGPGLSFYGDADTGLYRSGANTIGVATNGTNVATFATTGFSVTGTLSASGAFTAGSSILSGGLSATTGTFTTSVISPNLAPTGNLTLTQNSVVPFTSVASGALVDTLTLKAGKVGIGTNNPTEVLQVSNSANNYTGFNVLHNSASGGNFLFAVTSNSHPTYAGSFGIYDNTAGAYRLVVRSDGTVTIPAANFDLTAGKLLLAKTVTAGGTTGAQTINKISGTVNFAAAATSLVVTNSTVTTSSIIVCTVGTVDTTMKTVVAVAGAGTFTITANAAATAETRVNFLVIN